MVFWHFGMKAGGYESVAVGLGSIQVGCIT